MESLPFYEFYQDFVEKNRGSTLRLFLGLGTSGRSNIQDCFNYINLLKKKDKNLYFFIIFIDPLYTSTYQRELTMSSYEDLEQADKPENEFIKAKTKNNDYLYLWGTRLPTAKSDADQIQLFQQLRNDPVGPYEYARSCSFNDTVVEKFYTPLCLFFKNTPFISIHVYNNAIFNSTTSNYTRNTRSFYRGNLFTDTMRYVQGRNPYGITYMSFIYFEKFCELLYCLSTSNKPVYDIKSENSRIIEKLMYNTSGGRRQTKKARKRRSQSRRRRTV